MKKLGAVLWLGASLWAQTALAPPQIGFMQDGAGGLRPVLGVAGNFLTGEAVLGDVRSAAFSGSYGLVKTGSTLLAIDQDGQVAASADAPDGRALFGFSRNGEPALAYIPAANRLIAWKNGAFETVPLDAASFSDGAAVSIGARDPDHAELIVQREGGLWLVQIALVTGEVDSQAALPGVRAPVLLLATGELVYGDANGIAVRKADGSERHVAAQLPESFALSLLGEGWVLLSDSIGGPQFAVRIAEGREQLYQLPEVSQ